MSIVSDYESGKTIAQIASDRKMPESKVRRFLVASGVEMRPQSRRKNSDIPQRATEACQ